MGSGRIDGILEYQLFCTSLIMVGEGVEYCQFWSTWPHPPLERLNLLGSDPRGSKDREQKIRTLVDLYT